MFSNHKDTRATFIADDIRDFEPSLDDDPDNDHGFDHVICNPPYLESGAHIQSPSAHKQLAIGLGEDKTLKDWIDAAHRNLRSGGTFTIINRADAATDKIIRKMGKRFGAIEIVPLWACCRSKPNVGLFVGLRTVKSPATLHPRWYCIMRMVSIRLQRRRF